MSQGIMSLRESRLEHGTRRESRVSVVARALVRSIPSSLQWCWFYKTTMRERERERLGERERWASQMNEKHNLKINMSCGSLRGEDKGNSRRFYKRTDAKGPTFRVGSIKELMRKAVGLFESVL